MMGPPRRRMNRGGFDRLPAGRPTPAPFVMPVSFVIPANAGIQPDRGRPLDPGFRRDDGGEAARRNEGGGGNRRKPRRGGHSLLVLLTSLLLAAPLVAQRVQDRPNAAEAEAAIAQLRSPYCPGLMLETCPSPQAGELRDSIYDLAAQGASTDEIVEWMLANHGEEWRGVPRMSGAGLWAWVIPPLAILLGLGILIGWLRANRSTPAEAATQPVTTLSEDDRAQLARALRDWEDSAGEDV